VLIYQINLCFPFITDPDKYVYYRFKKIQQKFEILFLLILFLQFDIKINIFLSKDVSKKLRNIFNCIYIFVFTVYFHFLLFILYSIMWSNIYSHQIRLHAKHKKLKIKISQKYSLIDFFLNRLNKYLYFLILSLLH
jgi:hypothetical protein